MLEELIAMIKDGEADMEKTKDMGMDMGIAMRRRSTGSAPEQCAMDAVESDTTSESARRR